MLNHRHGDQHLQLSILTHRDAGLVDNLHRVGTRIRKFQVGKAQDTLSLAFLHHTIHPPLVSNIARSHGLDAHDKRATQ